MSLRSEPLNHAVGGADRIRTGVRGFTGRTRTSTGAAEPKAVRVTGTWLYFIQADDDGPVKVGLAATPTDRLLFFQTGNHHELHLRHKIWTHPKAERFVHDLIQPDLHVRGEWFDASVLDAVVPLEAIVGQPRLAA